MHNMYAEQNYHAHMANYQVVTHLSKYWGYESSLNKMGTSHKNDMLPATYADKLRKASVNDNPHKIGYTYKHISANYIFRCPMNL